ncbi:MAG: hypothetical protein U1D55_14595 [Phycisphaerae bacterium]
MIDYQHLVFDWASTQSSLTAAVVMALGLLCGLQGFRFARMLMPIWCMLMAFHAGIVTAESLHLPISMTAVLCAAVIGFVTVANPKAARVTAAATTYGFIGYYFSFQAGLPDFAAFTFAFLGMCGGLAQAWIRGRNLPIVLTTFYGATLMIVAYVIATNRIAPDLGTTFVRWSERLGMMIPTVLFMLGVMNYSCQLNLQQGDLRTGGSKLLGATQ